MTKTQIRPNSKPLILIPNLPNDISTIILSFIPFSHHSRIKLTCKSWKSFFSSKTLISLRRTNPIQFQSHLLCIFPEDPSISPSYLFDPSNLAWRLIPPMPLNPHAYGLSNFMAISLNHYVYVIGGSVFDTRSYPMETPSSSRAIFRYDLMRNTWETLAPMMSARGSFACAAVSESGEIVVAGGGSKHTFFGGAGSRMNSVEKYDVKKDQWVSLDGLPRLRAGCVGFLVKKKGELEFWVMGGYGESRTVSGVFSMDEYYRDGVVLELKNGGKWREIDNMWEEGERRSLGKVVVLDGEESEAPGIFMLDEADIFRYDMSTNRWQKESTVPRKGLTDNKYGFAALDGELHVLSCRKTADIMENLKPRVQEKVGALYIQVYNPKKRRWRSLRTKPPVKCSLNFESAVMCTIRV
ncbi:hypothetical protein ACHQM5_027290 [Ranunculus cassubicifolius]